MESFDELGVETARGISLWRRRRRARAAGIEAATLAFGRGNPLPNLKNEDGEMHLGRVFVSAGVRLWTNQGGILRIGDGTCLDEGAEIVAWESVDIGKACYVGIDALIMDTDLHAVGEHPVRNKPVSVGDGAVIGSRSLILKGVSVGPRAVIHPGSIVTRDVPEDTEVRPEPAKALQ